MTDFNPALSSSSPSVLIASDHAGFDLRQLVLAEAPSLGLTFTDLGCEDKSSVDYPDYAHRLADQIAEGGLGILICGSGIGISIAANRHAHIRAALCHNSTDARLSRQHNNANVLVLGARTMGAEVALDCIRAFTSTAFEGGRHQRRLDKLSPSA